MGRVRGSWTRDDDRWCGSIGSGEEKDGLVRFEMLVGRFGGGRSGGRGSCGGAGMASWLVNSLLS